MESLISTIKQLVPLSAEEEIITKSLFTELNLKPGEYLLRDGQVCKHVAFINKGLVRYFINNEGDERTMFFSKEGEFVCNYISFLPQVASDKNIQALEPTQLYLISYEKLQRFYREVAGAEKFGRMVIEQVFLSAIQQLDSLYTDPPDVRYQQFLTHYPDLTQRIPQYHIASYVGIKPQSLSRIRKRIFGQ